MGAGMAQFAAGLADRSIMLVVRAEQWSWLIIRSLWNDNHSQSTTIPGEILEEAIEQESYHK